MNCFIVWKSVGLSGGENNPTPILPAGIFHGGGAGPMTALVSARPELPWSGPNSTSRPRPR